MKESLLLAAKSGKSKSRKFRRLKRKKINEKGIENNNWTVKCYNCGIIRHKRPECPNKERR